MHFLDHYYISMILIKTVSNYMLHVTKWISHASNKRIAVSTYFFHPYLLSYKSVIGKLRDRLALISFLIITKLSFQADSYLETRSPLSGLLYWKVVNRYINNSLQSGAMKLAFPSGSR